MKKILVMFSCLLVLLTITTQKTFAQELKQVRGLHGGVLFFKDSSLVIKSGEDLKFVIFEQEPVTSVKGYPKSPLPIEIKKIRFDSDVIINDPVQINEQKFNSVGAPFEYSNNPEEAPDVTTFIFLDYTFIISANDQAKLAINGPGKYTVFIEYFGQLIGELKVEVTEESSSNFDFIDFVAEDLLSLQEDILSESKEIKNRSLRSVASKVGRVVKYINRAKSNAEDADPSSCSDDLENALTAIEATLDKLESKSCAEISSKRCIPEDLVEDFSLDLEGLFDDLDEEVSVDDNEDDIPDACGS